jgi:hypothetical protein
MALSIEKYSFGSILQAAMNKYNEYLENYVNSGNIAHGELTFRMKCFRYPAALLRSGFRQPINNSVAIVPLK